MLRDQRLCAPPGLASVPVHVRKFPRDKWRMIYSSHDGAQAAVQITHRVQKTFALRDSNSYICINAGAPLRPPFRARAAVP
jgi:hypothetical protein